MSLRRQLSCSVASLVLGSACLPLSAATIGYYQFENTPGVLEDSSAADRELTLNGTTGGQTASPFGSVSNPPAGSVANVDAMRFSPSGTTHNRGYSATDVSFNDLTIEAFVNLESVDGNLTSRTIAAQFGASTTNNTLRAFNLAVVGNASTAFGNPTDDRTLFLQVVNSSGVISIVDTSFRLTLNTNYYVAASIDAGGANSGADGAVTIYLKDLTSPANTLQIFSMTVAGFSAFNNASNPLTIGSTTNGSTSRWDGLIDEVRFSNVALNQNELLIATIPEPSSAALLTGAAMLCLVGLRRRR